MRVGLAVHLDAAPTRGSMCSTSVPSGSVIVTSSIAIAAGRARASAITVPQLQCPPPTWMCPRISGSTRSTSRPKRSPRK